VPLPDDVVGVAVGDAVAVWTAGVFAWKARMPAVPAAVAARTMGDRRIRGLRLRT
jgi:hypothetical protein